MARLISKINLEAHVAPTELGYYAVNGLRFAADGVYSMDGYMLIRTPYPTEDVEDHPSGRGETPEPFTLPLAAAKRVLKNLPKVKSRPILEHAVLAQDEGAKIRLTVHDLEGETVIRTLPLEGEFPNALRELAKVKQGNRQTVTLGVALLKRWLQAAKRSGAEQLELSVSLDAEGPVGLTAKTNDGLETASGLLMPVTKV